MTPGTPADCPAVESTGLLVASYQYDAQTAHWLADKVSSAVSAELPGCAIEDFVKQAILYSMRAVGRFWKHTERRGTDECWPWTGHVDEDGYGDFYWTGWPKPAHQIAYALAFGPCPDGMTIDHTCHSRDIDCPGSSTCPHRRCVNPAHLEAVPGAVNTLRGRAPSALNRRKTECVRGHPFDKPNTRIRKNGSRACRACDHERDNKKTEKRRAEARLRGKAA